MPPTTQINIRRDTAANFTSANPTLALGEIAYETDTRNIKVGDGSTAWTALGYINPYRGGTASAPTTNTVLGNGAGAAMQSGATLNTVVGNNAGAAITTGTRNTAVGMGALQATQTGIRQTAVGYAALANSSGTGNTAVGDFAGQGISSGAANTVLGYLTMSSGGGSASSVTAVGSNSLQFNTASDITAVGANALDANTTGTLNTAVGMNALGVNTTGGSNVAVGHSALNASSTASFNTAVGHRCLFSATGGANTAVGRDALYSVTSGTANTAVGINALTNSTVSDLTAVGAYALDANTTGTLNTAVGRDALGATNTGASNVAVGHSAGFSNTTGSNNVALGEAALYSITTGSGNIAVGRYALYSTVAGASLVGVGLNAGFNLGSGGATNSVNTVCVGPNAGRWRGSGTDTLTRADNSIFIGNEPRSAGDSESNQIVIGHATVGNGSNTTTIGNSSTTGTFIPAGNLTLTNGNFIVGTSGKGIDFSATANGTGTMTSELLSDYEEGTWTPTYIPSGGSFATMTMDVVSATYTKIGRQVTVRAWIRTDNVDTTGASGVVAISGLPFTTAAGDAGRTSGYVGAATGWAVAGFPYSVISSQGATTMNVFKRAAADGVVTNVTPADFTTGAVADQNRLEFVCTYFT